MKSILLLFALFPVFIFGQTHYQFGTYVTCDIPNHQVMPKMSTNVGMGLQFAYKPLFHVPIAFELKSSTGFYSNRDLSQTYYFSDSSSTTTNVSYSSYMNKVLFGTKILIGSEFNKIHGYFTPQIGASFMRSKIRINDPKEEDDCKPLEKATTQKYTGFTYGAELGAEIDMRIFLKNIRENKHYLYASASFLNGFGKFEYVNVKYMHDHAHGALPEGGTTTTITDEDGRDITATFINVSTNSLHDHKIAELYRTNLQYWGFNIGYIIYF
jgi:hypothetical protein